jgi:predicted phosphodiesterase
MGKNVAGSQALALLRGTKLVPGLIRIFSDLHYGDRASRLRSLAQLDPLLEGVDQLILNGDTYDTRPSSHPAQTARIRAETSAYFARCAPAVTHLTGNHDPDISTQHWLDLAGGNVCVTHGDIIFEDVVPWGRDTAYFSARINRDLAALDEKYRHELNSRLTIYRAACLGLPQGHQAEPNPFKYALHVAADNLWPPQRSLRILRAWHETPARAAAIAATHRPAAQFMLIGHTHRPGVWPTPSGLTVINTGSFSRPWGALAVDLTATRLTVRRIVARGRHFRLGPIIAEFALAETGASAKITP